MAEKWQTPDKLSSAVGELYIVVDTDAELGDACAPVRLLLLRSVKFAVSGVTLEEKHPRA